MLGREVAPSMRHFDGDSGTRLRTMPVSLQARGQPDKNPQDTRHTRVHAAPQLHEAGAGDRIF